MLGAAVLASLAHSGVRFASAELPLFEVAFVRAVMGFAVLTIMMLFSQRRFGLRTRALPLQLLRGVIICASVMFWFYGLSTVPLAKVVVLSFSSSIFLTIGAAVFLHEKVGIRRWSAVAGGLLGALVILRPGLVDISLGALSTVLASILWAAATLLLRPLSRYDGNSTIVLYSLLAIVVITAIPTALVWEQPSVEMLWIILGLGMAAAFGHMAFANALRHADATITIPADYTRLLWSALLGYVLFHERPDIYVWIGAAMIIGSSLYITYRESYLEKVKQKSYV